MSHAFSADAYVQTKKGIVKGYELDGMLIFKGIPYAKARRFHAPKPVEPWEGVLDATSYGYICPVLTNERPEGELYIPHRYWPMDEDCLNLNIWTPGTDRKRRPVMVWLHGGGFSSGSAIEQVAYDGANMSRFGDAVVVSINHRLNILGYMDLSEYGEEYANSANAGTDDIIAALQWIKDNIAAFGGNPKNVTLFGQSGGGAKITTLLQTPAADGLFAKGINMSGVLGKLQGDNAGSGKPLAEALMAELGVSSVKDLETVDYHLLAKAYCKVQPALVVKGQYVGCMPKANAFYKGDPLAVGFREETKDVPLLVGSTFGEFTSFGPSPVSRRAPEEEQEKAIRAALGDENADILIPAFQEAYPERPLADLLRLDFIFRGPEIAYLTKRSAMNRCTYAYLFNMDQPIHGGTTPWHCSDIPYVFHNIDLVEYPHTPDRSYVSEMIQEEIFSAVMSFARTGSPAKGTFWPACTPETQFIRVIEVNEEQTGTERLLSTSITMGNFDHALIEHLSRIMGPILAKQMEERRKKEQK